jgi:ADP-dependent NAD(P)H-hydrate dehydratase / NAD(P)H-hydrate epimerase
VSRPKRNRRSYDSRLNDEQRRAVTALQTGGVMVVAGPGSASVRSAPRSVCYDKAMDLSAALKPLFNRPAAGHKYDFGHVLVVGGAPGMVGAPLLTARAALRTGAGLVTIASLPDVIDKLEKQVEEVMTLRLPTRASMATLADFIAKRKVTVLAVGPGLNQTYAGLVTELLLKVRLPVVLDAGGLAAYNGRLADLREAASSHNPDIVLTPHPGEFARLIGKPLLPGGAASRKAAADTARITGTTIVLKGHRSSVAGRDGQTFVNDTGNPGLATAGSGDVLTGMIAGLCAQGLGSYEAACAGVYLHGLAGDLAAAAKTEPGLIAHDVIEFIPAALKQTQATG